MGKQGPQTHPDRRQKKKPFQVGPKLAKGSYTGHSQSCLLAMACSFELTPCYAQPSE